MRDLINTDGMSPDEIFIMDATVIIAENADAMGRQHGDDAMPAALSCALASVRIIHEQGCDRATFLAACSQLSQAILSSAAQMADGKTEIDLSFSQGGVQ